MRPDLDAHCSKTTLLFFTNRNTANMFASRFLLKNPDLRRPWRLESMSFEDLQKICLLNYLDTYLCFHVSQVAIAEADTSSDSEEDCVSTGTRGALLDCYEYKSAEYPSRQILNMIMENLWQQN